MSLLLSLSANRTFDKDHIDAAIMKKIQTYTPQPDFQPEKIEKVNLLSCYCVCASQIHELHQLRPCLNQPFHTLRCWLPQPCTWSLQVSKAAYGLCCWIRAMEVYDRVAKVVGPKKEALKKAEGELQVTLFAGAGYQDRAVGCTLPHTAMCACQQHALSFRSSRRPQLC